MNCRYSNKYHKEVGCVVRVTDSYSVIMEQYKSKEVQGAKNSGIEMKPEMESYPEKTIITEIEKANGTLNTNQYEYEFTVHEKTKQIMVKVIDAETKEKVTEFPSEKILDMVAKMCELAGLFIDEKR